MAGHLGRGEGREKATTPEYAHTSASTTRGQNKAQCSSTRHYTSRLVQTFAKHVTPPHENHIQLTLGIFLLPVGAVPPDLSPPPVSHVCAALPATPRLVPSSRFSQLFTHVICNMLLRIGNMHSLSGPPPTSCLYASALSALVLYVFTLRTTASIAFCLPVTSYPRYRTNSATKLHVHFPALFHIKFNIRSLPCRFRCVNLVLRRITL